MNGPRRAPVPEDDSGQAPDAIDALMDFDTEKAARPDGLIAFDIEKAARPAAPSLVITESVPVVRVKRRRWTILLAMMVVGLVGLGTALASRFLVDMQDDPATAPTVHEVLPQQSASPPAPPPAPAETATPSDSTNVTAATKGSEEAATAPARRRTGREPSSPSIVSTPNGPGALLAASIPQGARVFVDGVLVGTTPFLLPGVSAGSHEVRIELAGFQTWSSSVQIEPNERFRLGVRLQQ